MNDIFDLLVGEDLKARELAGIDEEGKRVVYSNLTGFVRYKKWLLKQGS